MARKMTRKGMKRKCDKLFSAYIRSRGACEWCGKSDDTLQCAHIFSRRYLVTRWDELNALCLCAGCHFKAHHKPLEFAEFVNDHLGEIRYLKLMKEAKRTIKYIDLEAIIKLRTLLKSNDLNRVK